MTEQKWIKFSDRLPTAEDADAMGKLIAVEQSGRQREIQWNWISPTIREAKQVWHTNGFQAWKKET